MTIIKELLRFPKVAIVTRFSAIFRNLAAYLITTMKNSKKEAATFISKVAVTEKIFIRFYK